MKVLMKKDLRKVGKRGEVIDVSDGYGANYLIPNGFGLTTLKVNIFNGVIGVIRVHVSLKEKK